MDEYIDMPPTHNASFRKYLKERIVDVVHPKIFHFIDGEVNTDEECQRVGHLITDNPIDVSFIDIRGDIIPYGNYKNSALPLLIILSSSQTGFYFLSTIKEYKFRQYLKQFFHTLNTRSNLLLC